MISKLSVKLVKILLSNQIDSEDERELYCYGCFIFLSHLLYLALASILGFFLDCFLESVVFYIAFQLIRRNAGGYHASTETACEILSTLLLSASIIIIKLSIIYDFEVNLLLITSVASVIIYVVCPLDTPAKTLSQKELQYFKIKSRVILFVQYLIIIVSYLLNFKLLFAPVCLSLILESILLFWGKIKTSL